MVWLTSRGDDDKSIRYLGEFYCFNQNLQEGGYNYLVVSLKVSPNNFGDVVHSTV